MERVKHNFMRIGDKVRIIKSPYSSVKKGTIAYIENIKIDHFIDHFGRKSDLYELANLSHKLFRKEELERVDD